MKNCAFTIVAKNYIGLAQILEKSIKQYFQDFSFYIIIADEVGDEIICHLPDNNIIARDKFSISTEQWTDLSFKYDVTEFCTAIKPLAFRYLLDNTEHDKIIYLDPDTFFFNSIGLIFDMLNNHNILITPHIALIETKYSGDKPESDLLGSGIFNLGFCGISRSTVGGKFIDWWHSRLLDKCFIDLFNSYFTDQKWINFLPSFFEKEELLIVRHLGMNIAPWNYFERKISRNNGQLFVYARNHQDDFRSYPLIFMHFSGYNYKELKIGNVIHNNPSLPDYVDIRQLILIYSEALSKQKDSFDRFIQLSYSYDTYNNGDSINGVHRRLYRSLTERGEIISAPYSTESGSFYQKLKSKGMIKLTPINLDKITKINLNGVNKRLRVFNSLSRILFKLLGYKNYILFIKMMRPFARPEAQIHLIDKRYDSSNIFNN